MTSNRKEQPPKLRNIRRPSPPPSSIDSSIISFDGSLTPPWSRRRSPAPTTHRIESVVMNRTFQKLLLLLFLVVIFDLVYLWDYFDSLEDESVGPEAGMHHLHESKRLGTLYHQLMSGLQLGQSKSTITEARTFDPEIFDKLPDGEKIEELKREVQFFREKYEVAMSKLGENPYPAKALPVTPIPPNQGNDDGQFLGISKRKKSRSELEKEETYGADERIVQILHSANVEIDQELAEQLPTWNDVVSLYGDKPIIHGLESCEPYRQKVKPEDRMVGPAGMFNTGTNLLFEYMKTNCNIKEARYSQTHYEPRRNGMRWQAPWGKHNPPSTHRLKNVAKAWGKDIKQEYFFPVVLIKDPYSWMGSQCRHKYTTFWGHDDHHCPNLIRWRIPDQDVPSEVRVKYALNMKLYESLLDMWNRWYEEWEAQTFPHLITRFEDLLFHGEEITKTACECVGGIFTDNFEYVEDSAKPARGIHKGANGLVKAMLQYGDPSKRLTGFTDRDRWYASKTMDTELMRKYGYTDPPLPTD